MINAPISNEDPSLSPWRLQFSVDKVHLNLNIGLKLNFQIISDRIELKFCRNWSIDVSKSETWMLPLECVFCCTRLTVHFLFEVKIYPNTVFHEKITECQFLCGYIKIIILHQNLYLSVSFYEFYILKLYLIWREELFEADFRFEFFSLKYFLCKNNFVWAFFKESHSIAPPPLSLENSNSLTLHDKIIKK